MLLNCIEPFDALLPDREGRSLSRSVRKPSPRSSTHPYFPKVAVTPTKTLQEREQELRSMLSTPAGLDQLQQLESRYVSKSGRDRPPRASIITYILVYERELGSIQG
jgi:hypothetical protein